jgi:hypothetical protein
LSGLRVGEHRPVMAIEIKRTATMRGFFLAMVMMECDECDA